MSVAIAGASRQYLLAISAKTANACVRVSLSTRCRLAAASPDSDAAVAACGPAGRGAFGPATKAGHGVCTFSRIHCCMQPHAAGSMQARRRSQYAYRALTEHALEYGTKKWTFVANKLEEKFKIRTRTGKQCRER